jgi:hypothetical protein
VISLEDLFPSLTLKFDACPDAAKLIAGLRCKSVSQIVEDPPVDGDPPDGIRRNQCGNPFCDRSHFVVVVSISHGVCGASEICCHTSVRAQANVGGAAGIERLGGLSIHGNGADK